MGRRRSRPSGRAPTVKALRPQDRRRGFLTRIQAQVLAPPVDRRPVDAHLRNHMLPSFGDRALASIRPTEVQAWVRGRTEALAPATVETVFRIFSAILSDAVRDRLIVHNPAKNTRLPRKAKSAIVPPTVEQVEAVIAEMAQRR